MSGLTHMRGKVLVAMVMLCVMYIVQCCCGVQSLHGFGPHEREPHNLRINKLRIQRLNLRDGSERKDDQMQ